MSVKDEVESIWVDITNTNTGSYEVVDLLERYSREAIDALVASGRAVERDGWLEMSPEYLESVGLKYCARLNQFVARDGSDCSHVGACETD